MAQLPKSSSANLDAALVAFRAGDLPGARRRVMDLLKLKPQDIAARFLLARLWLEGGDLPSGRRELEVLLKQAPGHGPAHVMMGQVLVHQGEKPRARQYFERAIALNDQIPEAWAQAAILDEEFAGLPKALDRLQRASQALPSHFGILTNLGIALGKSGDKVAARKVFERALQIEERSELTHFNLGRLLREAGEVDAALRHYRRAIELKADFADAYHNLGYLLLDLHQVAEATEAFRAATRLRFAPAAQLAPGNRSAVLFRRTTAAKMRHDIEQFRYLREQGVLAGKIDQIIADHESVLTVLPAPTGGDMAVDLPPTALTLLAPSYNRLLHWDAGAALSDPAVNPALDWAAIERGYHQQAPGIAWFDGLLTEEAMTALRRFCMNSTIWSEFRYHQGYVGSVIESGFCCPLLFQIADELAAAMPTVFDGHPVTKMWAFKYDHRLSGIPIHADFAAVNVNFWITPDNANLNPEDGGLKVWNKEAPLDWDFATYNNDEPAIRQFLRDSDAQMINVPHRQNRTVMFNSDLFHETGSLNFREGYENRRINVTMLFGRRHASASPARQ